MPIPPLQLNMIIVLMIFILTYALLLVFSSKRAFIALGAAVIFFILGLTGFIDLTPLEVFQGIEWNVLLMIFGTMGLVSLFIESKMPSLLADKIIAKSPNAMWATIALSVFAGLISAFIDNVATVLMIAPIAITVAKKLNKSPVPMVIAIAVASNLEGAATLVGDTTSILMGQHLGMNFLDFFFYNGKVSLFFINQLGLIVATIILFIIFRKDKEKIASTEVTHVSDYLPTVLMVSLVLLLIVASFIPNTPELINGYICVGLMVIGVAYKTIRTKKLSSLLDTLKEVDYQTLLLLTSIFVIVSALINVGLITWIGEVFVAISGGNVFVVYTILVWFSVIISAFIDNIPYVAMMLGVVSTIGNNIGVDPTVLYFGLLCGATLGGNLTPIGASANVTAIGLLRKQGFEVKTWDFMRIGLPYTLAAITTAYVFVWLIWHP